MHGSYARCVREDADGYAVRSADLAAARPEAPAILEVVDGVEVVELPRPPALPGGGAVGWTAGLVRAALAGRPDVIHIGKPKGYSGPAGWLLSALGRPWPVDLHPREFSNREDEIAACEDGIRREDSRIGEQHRADSRHGNR